MQDVRRKNPVQQQKVQNNVKRNNLVQQKRVQNSQVQYKKGISKSVSTYKTNSCKQINKTNKANHLVHDHLINTFDPKRTSINLNSFIQVFRKKVRQSSIAKQFQNSLQKFKSISIDRNKIQRPNKGGFIGHHKKSNELLIQNNKTDNKIKKIIISDLQFKQRKIRRQNNNSRRQTLLNKMSDTQYKMQNAEFNQNAEHNISAIYRHYWDQQNNNDCQNNNFQTKKHQTLYHQKINPQNKKLMYRNQKVHTQTSQKSSIFTNRRLQTIVSYQRPNLMYNLNLYRKKHSYNVLKNNQKNILYNQLNNEHFGKYKVNN